MKKLHSFILFYFAICCMGRALAADSKVNDYVTSIALRQSELAIQLTKGFSLKTTSTARTKGQITTTGYATRAFLANHAVIESDFTHDQNGSKIFERTVQGYNPVYSFDIAKSKQNQDSWLLTRSLLSSESAYPGHVNDIGLKDFPYTFAECVDCFDGPHTLSELIKSDGFRLHSIEEERDRVITISCTRSLSYKGSSLKVQCKYSFDMSRFGMYVFVSEVVSSDRILREYSVTRDIKFKDQEAAIECDIINTFHRGETYSATHVATSLLNFGRDLPESRFRLTHYGLPEPEGVVWEKPIPSYVWYLSIAGGALVIMFLCGWLLKRRARSRAAAATTTSAPPNPPAKPI